MNPPVSSMQFRPVFYIQTKSQIMTKRFKLLCFAALMSVLSVVPVDADAQIFAGEKVP